jgi:hypothetical protein
MIFFNCHPPATPIPLLAAGEIGVNVGGSQRQPGGHPFEDSDQLRAVRFTCGQET